MNDDKMIRLGKGPFKQGEHSWAILLSGVSEDGESALNFKLFRTDEKFFHSTLVEEPNKNGGTFSVPITVEHGNAEKVGDVVLILRKSPKGRWMIQAEKEIAHITDTESKEVYRAKRASLDNPDPAVKRSVVKVGEGYANPRRLGGQPVFKHYLLANWSPQLAAEGSMMDIYDYVQCTDMIGQSVLLAALSHMADEVAHEILYQIRAPYGGE